MIETLYHIITPLAVTGADLSPGLRGEVWDLVLHAGPVVKLVIALLLLLSVGCWGIMLYKFLVLRSAIKESEHFLALFWEGSSLEDTYRQAETLRQSPLAEIFRSGYLELKKFTAKENANHRAAQGQSLQGFGALQRALHQADTSEQSRLEKNLGFLATTGSTAPFIGLFGTVWGIMDSFQNIGITGSANLASVAPGISEALIATAFGLVAAIPAVVAYNYFLGKIRMIASEMENFSAEFLNIIERHFDSSE